MTTARLRTEKRTTTARLVAKTAKLVKKAIDVTAKKFRDCYK